MWEEGYHEPFNFQTQLAADPPEAGKVPETSVVRVRIHLGCVALRKKNQKICQKECQIECQKEYQKICQKECQVHVKKI